jgi:hypothetical protein
LSEKKDNPYVTRDFCDERVKRIEEKIGSMKDEILAAINAKTHSSLSGTDKAALGGSVLIAVASIIVAFIK